MAAVCTGAFVLGEAGLLDGRRVTTHWMHARELQEQFPNCAVDMDRIFINDGPIWTSAGMSAGIDLALALIEADLGQEVAERPPIFDSSRGFRNRPFFRADTGSRLTRCCRNPRPTLPAREAAHRAAALHRIACAIRR